MKTIITSFALVLSSIIFVSLILGVWKKRMGLLKSISAYAKPLHDNGKAFQFHILITFLLCVPVAFVTQTWIGTIACMLMFGIGTITGYNPNYKLNKFQHTFHIILVVSSIGLYVFGMALNSLWYLILIGICAVYCIVIFAKKLPYYTRTIEIYLIWLVWIYLLIDKCIIPLINILK